LREWGIERRRLGDDFLDDLPEEWYSLDPRLATLFVSFDRDNPMRQYETNIRWVLYLLGIVVVIYLSAEQLIAADTIAKQIQNLSSPNIMTRANACNAIADVDAENIDMAVNALIGALGDVSGSVKLAAVMALGKIGPPAIKAVPNIIECYQKDTVAKAEIIRTLGCIGQDSPEAIDFLIAVVRGGKGGAIRPLDGKQPPKALRQEAIATLGKVGPKAKKCIPALLDILNVAAADVAHQEQLFTVTVDALSVIGIGDKRVLATLKRFQQGKGFRAKNKGTQALDHAILSADSAVKRLERAEQPDATERKMDEQK
jgi:HEAT repeat protein